MGPHEPYWRTNTSFSPPLSRTWEHRLQPEELPYGSRGGIQLYESSISSNSKESGTSVRNDHFLNHPASDGAGSYFSSPSDSFQTHQWTSTPIKGVTIDDYVSGPTRESASEPLGVSQSMEGTSGLAYSAGSTSSRSDSSEYEATVKANVSSNRNFSRCSFISKPIHPISIVNQAPQREARVMVASENSLNQSTSNEAVVTTQREALRWSSESSSIDFDDVSEQLDSESTVPSYAQSEEFKCCLCNRLLSQRSPWSSRRIIKSGDMPVTGVLSCRHVFHAECLDQTTPKIQKNDPPCPLCTKLDENALEQPLISRLRIGLPRFRPLMEDGPSSATRTWGCGHVGDCVEGALHASPCRNMQLLNRSRLRKHLSLKGNSSKEIPDKLRKSGSFSPQLTGKIQQEAVEHSTLTAGSTLKRW